MDYETEKNQNRGINYRSTATICVRQRVQVRCTRGSKILMYRPSRGEGNAGARLTDDKDDPLLENEAVCSGICWPGCSLSQLFSMERTWSGDCQTLGCSCSHPELAWPDGDGCSPWTSGRDTMKIQARGTCFPSEALENLFGALLIIAIIFLSSYLLC